MFDNGKCTTCQNFLYMKINWISILFGTKNPIIDFRTKKNYVILIGFITECKRR